MVHALKVANRDQVRQESLWSDDFQHPQATHQILLGDTRVAYRLERAARRSIGFQVGAEGLRVRAPRWLTLDQVHTAITEKSRWILEKLRSQRMRSTSVAERSIVWEQGVQLPFMGGTLTLHLNAAAPRQGCLLAIAPSRWCLHLALDAQTPALQIRAAVAAWWLRHAREYFTERLNHFAPQLGVHWRSLRLSNARTRWGSAKVDGSIMLNWKLLHCAAEVIDYVVVHELAHLRHMDHSARFWAVVESSQPRYSALRAQLKEHVSPVW